jgi:hypothetical protein
MYVSVYNPKEVERTWLNSYEHSSHCSHISIMWECHSPNSGNQQRLCLCTVVLFPLIPWHVMLFLVCHPSMYVVDSSDQTSLGACSTSIYGVMERAPAVLHESIWRRWLASSSQLGKSQKKLCKSTVRQSSGQLQNEGSKRGTHAFDLSLGSQN